MGGRKTSGKKWETTGRKRLWWGKVVTDVMGESGIRFDVGKWWKEGGITDMEMDRTMQRGEEEVDVKY